MELVLVGLNHETAPVTLRERVSFDSTALTDLLPKLEELPYIDEAAVLSTCNRTEIMGTAIQNEPALTGLTEFLAETAGMDVLDIQQHLYTFSGLGVVEHLFRVAAGLESMVLGEPQIAGQVKEAFDLSIELGTARTSLMNLYRHTLQTVKQVRNDTDISKSAVSVSYVAVELARKVFQELNERRALLVGAGEMCELAATHLKERGVECVDVVNRTLSKAEALAERFGGDPYPLDRLQEALLSADIVLSSTGAKDPVITEELIRPLMKKRRSGPLLLIDIAVPRDIDPACGELDSVFLFDIDDLQKVIAANMEKRRREAERAGELIRKRVKDYDKWCRMQEVNPVIVGLRQKAEQIRRDELEKSLKKLKDEPEEVRQELDRLSYAIINKMLHQPITELKRAAREEDLEHGLMHFFKSIFKLE